MYRVVYEGRKYFHLGTGNIPLQDKQLLCYLVIYILGGFLDGFLYSNKRYNLALFGKVVAF